MKNLLYLTRYSAGNVIKLRNWFRWGIWQDWFIILMTSPTELMSY